MQNVDIPLEELAEAHRVMNRVFMASVEGRLKHPQNDTVSWAASGRRVLEFAMREGYGDKNVDDAIFAIRAEA